MQAARITLPAVAGLANPARVINRTLAKALTPRPFQSVADWAAARRVVSADTGSPRPGKWLNSVAPEAIEVMMCLDERHPARNVTVRGAAQMWKSEVGLNLIGRTIDQAPRAMILAFPSIEELRQYNTVKLTPMIQASKLPVFSLVERSQAGSTSTLKKFSGGFLSLITTSSAKGMQARSAGIVVGEEVSNWIDDPGGRGDPIVQLRTRADAYEDPKFYWSSTPGELPHCKITIQYDEGDQRIRYHECPHCGDWHPWAIEDLRWDGTSAALACRSCGSLIPDAMKDTLRQTARWVKTFRIVDADGVETGENRAPPEIIPATEIDRWSLPGPGGSEVRPSSGRDPSFGPSQLFSPFKSWTILLQEADAAAKGDLKVQKAFRQQKLGLPWDPNVEAADADALHAVRGRHVGARGTIPSWACRLTMAIDIGDDNLEWAVYAWGPGLTGARIDWGLIEGDPTKPVIYQKLNPIVAKTWQGSHTRPLALDAVVIDSGGKAGTTPMVYAWAGRRMGVYAVKGDTGVQERSDLFWRAEKLSKKKTTGGRRAVTRLHFVANHETKALVSAGLKTTLAAAEAGQFFPGGLYFGPETSLESCKQLTAEVYKPSPRPHARGTWEKTGIAQRNEQLDLARYALSVHWWQTRGWDDARWTAEFAARAGAPDQPAQHDAPLLALLEQAAPAAPAAPIAANPTGAPTAPTTAPRRRSRVSSSRVTV
jgi:phage terminase large subunit GpA-like protein